MKTSLAKIHFELGANRSTSLNLESTSFLGHTGLRHRLYLPYDDGLFFDMGTSGTHSFWMESVSIPIDIIFISSDLRVVDIHYSAKPFDKTPISSSYKFRYAVEVNAGWCAYSAIHSGCKVSFSGIL